MATNTGIAKANVRRQIKLRLGEMRADKVGGLLEFELRNQGEVARMLGITAQAVRETERRALSKLRRGLWSVWQDFIRS